MPPKKSNSTVKLITRTNISPHSMSAFVQPKSGYLAEPMIQSWNKSTIYAIFSTQIQSDAFVCNLDNLK